MQVISAYQQFLIKLITEDRTRVFCFVSILRNEIEAQVINIEPLVIKANSFFSQTSEVEMKLLTTNFTCLLFVLRFNQRQRTILLRGGQRLQYSYIIYAHIRVYTHVHTAYVYRNEG